MFLGQCANWSTVPAEVGNGLPCDSKDTRHIDGMKTTDAPRNSQAGIRPFPPEKSWDR